MEKRLTFEPKMDCFAFKERHCAALDRLYCKLDGRCPFYKTYEQNEYENYLITKKMKKQ